jgi:hypothetical protein
MKRIQIVISAELPEGDDLDSLIKIGRIAEKFEVLVPNGDSEITVSKPEIVTTRSAPIRARSGKKGDEGLPTAADVRGVLASEPETMPDIPESLRRTAIAAGNN